MKILKTLAQSLMGVAPTVANVLLPGAGGAITSAAVQAVGSAMGLTPDEAQNPESVQAAVEKATPEQIIALRQADQQFALSMKEAGIELAKIHQRDRSDARQMQMRTRGWSVPVLAFVTVGAFCGLCAAVVWQAFGDAQSEPPPAVQNLLFAVVGYLAAAAQQVLAYFFGSSEGNEATRDRLTDAVNGARLTD